MHPYRDRSLNRRSLLLGGGAALALAGCGSSGRGASGTTLRSGPGPRTLLALVGSGALAAGARQRVPFSLADSSGAPMSGGPASLDLDLTLDGRKLARLHATRHQEGLARSYYPFEIDVASRGFYTVEGRAGADPVSASFAVDADVAIPQVGRAMPRVSTPTTSDRRGVSPICSRNPVCPLHAVDAADVLAARRPLALLVSTPAFCQVDICGPVLDLLVAESRRQAGRIACVHAEVYQDGRAAAANVRTAALAPVVQALYLPFEPCLFVVGVDGKVKVRLDSIFDALELRQALLAATA